jgi:serine protease SohB
VGDWVINIVTFFIQAVIVIGLVGLTALLFRRAKSGGDDDGLTLHIETLNDQRRQRHRQLDTASKEPKRGKKWWHALCPKRKAGRKDKNAEKTARKKTLPNRASSPVSGCWIFTVISRHLPPSTSPKKSPRSST